MMCHSDTASGHQANALQCEMRRPGSAYVLALMLPHGLNQVDCTNNVMCVVQHGKLHALSDSFAPSKVDDSIKPTR